MSYFSTVKRVNRQRQHQHNSLGLGPVNQFTNWASRRGRGKGTKEPREGGGKDSPIKLQFTMIGKIVGSIQVAGIRRITCARQRSHIAWLRIWMRAFASLGRAPLCTEYRKSPVIWLENGLMAVWQRTITIPSNRPKIVTSTHFCPHSLMPKHIKVCAFRPVFFLLCWPAGLSVVGRCDVLFHQQMHRKTLVRQLAFYLFKLWV